jgi:LysR family transcriptional activator of nhaA
VARSERAAVPDTADYQRVVARAGRFHRPSSSPAPGARSLVLTEAGRLAFNCADDMFRPGAEIKETLEGVRAGTICNSQWNRRRRTKDDRLPIAGAGAARSRDRAHCRAQPRHGAGGHAHRHHGTVRAFNHLLGECGITFFAARKLAPRYRRRFLESLRDAPLLLPATYTALRGALMQWFDQRGIKVRTAAEFEDSALMSAFRSSRGWACSSPHCHRTGGDAPV